MNNAVQGGGRQRTAWTRRGGGGGEGQIVSGAAGQQHAVVSYVVRNARTYCTSYLVV